MYSYNDNHCNSHYIDGHDVNANTFNYEQLEQEYLNNDFRYYDLKENHSEWESKLPNLRTSPVSNCYQKFDIYNLDENRPERPLENTFYPISQPGPLLPLDERQTFENSCLQESYSSPQNQNYSSPFHHYYQEYPSHWATTENTTGENSWYQSRQPYVPLNNEHKTRYDPKISWTNPSNLEICCTTDVLENIVDNDSLTSLISSKSEKDVADYTEELTNLRSLRQLPLQISKDVSPPSEMVTQAHSQCNQSPGHLKMKRKRKAKTVYTDKQREGLEKEFKRTSRYLSRTRRKQLARDLNLDEENIKVWFQNRRIKAKREIEKIILRNTQDFNVEFDSVEYCDPDSPIDLDIACDFYENFNGQIFDDDITVISD